MATITASVTDYGDHKIVTWVDMATGDTIEAFTPNGFEGLTGTVHFVAGTAGGATVTLTGSNDETNFATIQHNGADISVTASGLSEFSTGSHEVKPGISGGTGDSWSVYACFRRGVK